MPELTWNANGTDWDAAQDQSGVVHESTANTDHTDASQLKQGYSTAPPEISSGLELYLPCHEDSGTTAYDFSGGANHGTYRGPTLGQPGLLGTTAPNLDGTDDLIQYPTLGFVGSSGLQSFTASLWVRFDTTPGTSWGNYHWLWHPRSEADLSLYADGTTLVLESYDGTANQLTADTLSVGPWNHITVTYDTGASTYTLYVGGAEVAQGTLPTPGSTSGANGWGGQAYSTTDVQNVCNGSIGECRFYSRVLSPTEIQSLTDVVATSGTLTTAPKSA